MKISEILFKAAERFETHGWVQGRLGPVEGPNCATGVLSYVQPKPWYSQNLIAESLLRGFIDTELVTWNDEPGRTKEEVQDLFIAAAVDAEEEGI